MFEGTATVDENEKSENCYLAIVTEGTTRDDDQVQVHFADATIFDNRAETEPFHQGMSIDDAVYLVKRSKEQQHQHVENKENISPQQITELEKQIKALEQKNKQLTETLTEQKTNTLTKNNNKRHQHHS